MAKAKRGGGSNLRPYADDEAAMTIGGFTAENGTTCVSLSGSLDLTRDKAGLEKARQVKGLLDAVVAALEAASDLPDQANEETNTAKTVRNPFE